jgi:hypothetical protein
MKIRRATFLGVRGVDDATYDFTDPRTGAPHGVVVFAGASGSGKTRVLEALVAVKEALGPYGLPTQGAPWIGDGSASKIVVTFQLDPAEQDYAGTSSSIAEGEVIFEAERVRRDAEDGLRAVLERYSHERTHGKLEYFPAQRRIPAVAPFGGLGVLEQRILRASKDPRKYSFVVQFLRALEHDRARAEGFATRLAALSPTVRHQTSEGEVIPRCFSSRGRPAVTALDLSDGEMDAVVFAATAVHVGLDHSLVLVDRPDLHLDDPSLVLRGLAGLGQDNQLFLAAGSALSASADGAHVVTLKRS